jgi:hypothetical protein
MSEADNGRGDTVLEHNPELAAQLRKHQEEYLWCMKQTELLHRHADQILILHDRQVIGSGSTGPEAWQDAERHAAEQGNALPPRGQLLVFVVPAQIWVEDPLASCHREDPSVPGVPAGPPGGK